MTADSPCVCVYSGNNLRLVPVWEFWCFSTWDTYCIISHGRMYTLIRYLWNFICIDRFLSFFQTKMNAVLVMDMELRRRTRVTCLCFGLKCSLLWLGAKQRRSPWRELLFCNIWLRTHYVLCHFEYHATLYPPSPNWHFKRKGTVIHWWCCKSWKSGGKRLLLFKFYEELHEGHILYVHNLPL